MLRLILVFVIAISGCATPSGDTSKSAKASRSYPRSTSAAANEVVLYALGLVNIGYRFGGDNPDSGLDCSGMTAYIFKEAVGITLPHSAAKQSRLGAGVSKSDLLPGDLVFFNTTGKPASHVGLYIGENRFVHAPSTNGKIQVASLSSAYFAQRYENARRILN